MPKIEKRDGGIPWLVEFHKGNLRSKLGALSDHGSDRKVFGGFPFSVW